MASGDTKTEHYLDVAANGSRADLPTDSCCETRSQTLIRGVAERIMDLEDEVQEWKDNPDVADIVATYADLQNYDTSTLTDKDIIRVLQDEQHDGESTYYRWDKTDNEFDYIGAVGSYYTEAEVDQLLSGKQNTLTAGSNIDITDDVISATDTTYSAFTGTDGQTAGVAGLVPAPAVADAGKFLKANGTWDAAGGDSMIKLTTADYNWNHNTGTETNPTSVAIWKLAPGIYYRDKDDGVLVCTGKFGALGQEHYIFIVGASYTDSSSKEQKPFTALKESDSGLTNAIATSYVFNVTDLTGTSIDYLSNYSIYNSGLRDRVQIGGGASSSANGNVAIGYNASSTGNRATAVGRESVASANGAIAIGSYSSATVVGQFDVGSTHTSDGYNSSNYRLLTGLYDGQSAHDAATVGQLSYRQKKPAVVWEVDGTTVTTGLVAVGEDMSANPNWQLTDLDMTPFTRIKIYSKAAQKAGTTASASTTPAIILEMSLDPRAAIAEYGGNYVSSNVVQKPNDPNRLCTLCCAVSADKTKFEVLRMTNLYGTAATSNSDVNAYVFKIEGYYD